VCELKKSVPDIKLYVIGEDMEGITDTLKKKAEHLKVDKNVSFLGRVSDKKRIEMLGECEFFFSSSDYESFGISLLESMASGIPVIASDIKAYRNLVKDGVNGFLLDFSKSEKVAKLILEIRNKDLSKITNNARKSSSEYDWEHAIKKIIKIYESCLVRRQKKAIWFSFL